VSPAWEKVVVGFDAQEASLDALRLGAELAAATGAGLHVAVVLPRGNNPFERAIAGGRISDELDETLFKAVAQQLGDAGVTRASLEGGLSGRSAARALHEYAEAEDAGLIVVGSSHRGGLGRVLPGSVGESLLRGAPCAVAVAPRGYAERERAPLGLVGVAFDGSEEAELALTTAQQLAAALGARLRVIAVVPELIAYELAASQMDRLLGLQRAEYSGILDEAVSAAGDETEVEPVLEEGDPAVQLAAQGAELDLLLIGSRGYGPVRGALLGAISTAVLRTSPCPVLVTPRDEPRRGAARSES
jgi:nucleotide-binding universal stress UspA family protein